MADYVIAVEDQGTTGAVWAFNLNIDDDGKGVTVSRNDSNTDISNAQTSSVILNIGDLPPIGSGGTSNAYVNVGIDWSQLSSPLHVDIPTIPNNRQIVYRFYGRTSGSWSRTGTARGLGSAYRPFNVSGQSLVGIWINISGVEYLSAGTGNRTDWITELVGNSNTLVFRDVVSPTGRQWAYDLDIDNDGRGMTVSRNTSLTDISNAGVRDTGLALWAEDNADLSPLNTGVVWGDLTSSQTLDWNSYTAGDARLIPVGLGSPNAGWTRSAGAPSGNPQAIAISGASQHAQNLSVLQIGDNGRLRNFWGPGRRATSSTLPSMFVFIVPPAPSTPTVTDVDFTFDPTTPTSLQFALVGTDVGTAAPHGWKWRYREGTGDWTETNWSSFSVSGTATRSATQTITISSSAATVEVEAQANNAQGSSTVYSETWTRPPVVTSVTLTGSHDTQSLSIAAVGTGVGSGTGQGWKYRYRISAGAWNEANWGSYSGSATLAASFSIRPDQLSAEVQVQAANAGGESAVSSATWRRPAAPPANVPTVSDIVFTYSHADTTALRFVASGTNVGSGSGHGWRYRYQVAGQAFTSWTAFTVQTPANSLSVDLTIPSGAASIDFEVEASNADGSSTTYSETWTRPAAPPPGAPTVSDITFNFNSASPRSLPFTIVGSNVGTGSGHGFKYRYREDTGPWQETYWSAFIVASPNPQQSVHTIAINVSTQRVTIEAQARNAGGDSNVYSEEWVRPAPPPEPGAAPALRYTTVAAVKAMMKAPTNTEARSWAANEYDTRLEQAIRTAENCIDAYCGRTFDVAAVEATERTYYRRGVDHIDTDDFIGTATVSIGGTSQESDTFRTSPVSDTHRTQYRGIHLLNAMNNTPWYLIEPDYDYYEFTVDKLPPVTVSARWGWARVPDAVSYACNLISIRLFRRPDDAALGILQVGGMEGGMYLPGFDNDVEYALAPYRLVDGI